MRDLRILPVALTHLQYWQHTEEKKYKRILLLLQNVRENPWSGIGKPEPLKHQLRGLWSRRIDLEHRLIYSFDEKYVYIWQARFHYVDVPDEATREAMIRNLKMD